MMLPPHLRALIRLKRARVDFLLIGAMAMNNYVPEVAGAYSTSDCDILLRPTLSNLRRALRELSRAGYALRVNDEPLLGLDSLILRRLLEFRSAVRAEKDGGLPLDLLVDAKGFRFEEWWRRRADFKAGNARIPCAARNERSGKNKPACIEWSWFAASPGARPPRAL
ncbi:MAG: hypothetical protein ACHQ49_13670 [Elusimicrobiota bacterium]